MYVTEKGMVLLRINKKLNFLNNLATRVRISKGKNISSNCINVCKEKEKTSAHN